MSLKKGVKPSHSIKFKLTFLFSGLFIFCSCVLFVSIYIYISTKLAQHDQNLIQAELRELSAQYSKDGLKSIESALEIKRTFHRQHPFFVRITDTRNTTLGIYLPSPWTEFNTNNLEQLELSSQARWGKLDALGGNNSLDFLSMRLEDGNWIQVGMSSEERQKILDRLKSTFFVVLGVMVFLGFVGGWILAYFALRPINNLIFSVDSVATGKMDTRVPISGNGDELDELAFRFNMMLGKIDTLLKAMKDCLDNVAHDLRTPVTRLRIIADRALTEPLSEQSQSKALTSCIKETMRIEVMLNMLLNISEAESGVMQINHQYIRVSELVENVVDAYRPVAEEKTITINVAGDTRLKCKLDPDRFCQILANILDNAIKYTPNDGQVSIAYYREKSYVIIKLQDTGIGISSTDLERIWERLYRGKQSRQQSGLGLGLSQAKAIAKAHMGDITVSSEPDIGSTFTISLHTPN